MEKPTLFMFRLLLVGVFFAPVEVHAECEPSSHSYDTWGEWILPEDLALFQPTGKMTYEEWARQMHGLSETMRQDSELHQRLFLDRLSSTITRILSEFDGTKETARWLRVDDFKPRLVPSVVDADGLSPPPKWMWEVLHEPSIQIPIADEQGWSCESKKRFAAYIHLFFLHLSHLQKEYIDKAVRSLRSYNDQWQHLIRKGYSQFPWEVGFNGLFLDEKAWGPQNWQFIFFHLAAGVGVANVSERNDRPTAPAVLVAAELGALRYFAQHRQHVGGSFAYSISNLQWGEQGIGAVFHLSGFHLGYSYGVGSTNNGESTFFLLFDVTKAIDDGLLAKKVPAFLKKVF